MVHRFEAIGKCIYCGADDPSPLERFTDEHIVPYALGGHWILPEASCQSCQKTINDEIESRLLSEGFKHFRAKHGLPSRHRRNRPPSVPLHTRGGRTLEMPAIEYTAPILLYHFSIAGLLAKYKYVPDPQAGYLSVLGGGDEETALQERYPEWDGAHALRFEMPTFARLIAKIGYGLAVALSGADSFRPLVRDIILGQSDDYYRFVGGESSEVPVDEEPGRHYCSAHILATGATSALIIGQFKLFSVPGTPLYHAVVGEIDFNIPEHHAAFARHTTAGDLRLVGSRR